MQIAITDKFYIRTFCILLASLVLTILLTLNDAVVKIFSINMTNIDAKTIISLFIIYFVITVASLCIYLIFIGFYQKKYVLILVSILILAATIGLIFIMFIFLPFISWRIWGFAP